MTPQAAEQQITNLSQSASGFIAETEYPLW